MTRNFFKDLLRYLPAYVVPALVGFISIPIITRLFEPGEYGHYSLVISAVNISLVIIGWISIPIIRFHPAYARDNRLGEFYITVLAMTVISIAIISFAFFGILFSYKSNISKSLYSLMQIGILVFILSACFCVLLEFFRANRQIGLYSFFDVWKSISAIGFGISLIIIFRFGIHGLLWGSILGLVIALPFIWILSAGKANYSLKDFSIPLTLDLAKYGFPLAVGNLAAWILSLSDRYVLQFFRTSQEVGIYSASYGISERSVMLIATLFSVTSGSTVYNTWEEDGLEKTQEFITMTTRYYLLASIPAVVGLSVISKPLVAIMTGKLYHEGFTIIPFVVVGGFFLGLQQRFQPGLNFYSKTNLIMLATVVSGLFNLLLNLFFIPRYGYIAAAISTLFSYGLFLLLIIVFSRRFFIWAFPFGSLIKATWAAAIMGIFLYYMSKSLASLALLNLLLLLFFGGLIYISFLFLLNEFQPKEIAFVKKLFNKS